MDVEYALKNRIATRQFLDKPVGVEEVRAILDIARWSPSGSNFQPWRVHVVSGTARDRLVAEVRERMRADPAPEDPEFSINLPPSLDDPWRSRREEAGKVRFELLDIPREDHEARMAHISKNYEFFGAPVGLFFSINRAFDRPQWADLGMLIVSICLTAHERGLATCPQLSWSLRRKTVSDFLALPNTEQLFCGMSLGYRDPDAPINRLRTQRAEVDEFVTFLTE